MRITVRKATTATSKRTGKDFQIVIGATDDNQPIKFFAGVDEYKVGDKVELYVDTDFNFNARISHRKL